MIKTWSPKEIAEYYGVSPRKPLLWIASGELCAVNIAGSVNAKKPRWRISAESLAAFERRRSSAATAQTKQPVRRRRGDTAVIQFF
jgi:hypothetical protein